jgi:predicted nucleic acid-binding protein
LDTNILSELRKGNRCDSNVRDWALEVRHQPQFISVLSLGEIRKGIELLRKRNPQQCPIFEKWLVQLRSDYLDETLPVTTEVTDRWGHLMGSRTLPAIDGLLAATALVHGLTLATRNVQDFVGTGVVTWNPFDGRQPPTR